MLIASLAYALYCVLLRRWTMPLSLWESLYVQSVCATVQFLPIYLLAPPSSLTLQNIPLILYAGVVASVIAPFLWMLGIANLGASRTSSFMNLFPVITALFAIGFLKETIQPYHFVGGFMALGGVMLSQMKLKFLTMEKTCQI